MNNHPTLLLTGTLSASLKDKTIIMAVTGSIAAVRTIELARELVRHGATVRAVMSQAAQGIIHPDALHYATGNPVITGITGAVEHVEYCGEEGTADLLMVVPCTANTISKMSLGIDDTPPTTFTTTAIGSGVPVLVVPAMHGSMYNHLAVKENIERLKGMGVQFIDPVINEKTAKIAANKDIVLEVQRILGESSLGGKKVVITGGGTMERIDAIRVLTNRSSGRTGVELAMEAYRRGADVTLVHPRSQGLYGITEIEAESAKEMSRSVLHEIGKGCDLFISSAAISDFTIEPVHHKIKSGKEAITLTLRPGPKMLQDIREMYPDLDIIGFKAEANVDRDGLVLSAKELMAKYGLSMVVANDVGEGGMGTPDNTVLILDSSGGETGPVTGDKQVIAGAVLERFIEVNG
jgi:phosphopantothenoylcysteine decarboxylase/phosphopantothenate--cysteine ligase